MVFVFGPRTVRTVGELVFDWMKMWAQWCRFRWIVEKVFMGPDEIQF